MSTGTGFRRLADRPRGSGPVAGRRWSRASDDGKLGLLFGQALLSFDGNHTSLIDSFLANFEHSLSLLLLLPAVRLFAVRGVFDLLVFDVVGDAAFG